MRGKAFATAGFLVGITLSLGSNIFDSYLRTVGRPVPMIVGSLAISAFWPVALWLALEVMARVDWPPGRWFWAARYLGFGLLAAATGYVSFRHMHGLYQIFGEETAITYVGPGSVDALMILRSAALIAVNKQKPREGEAYRGAALTTIPENRPEAVSGVPSTSSASAQAVSGGRRPVILPNYPDKAGSPDSGRVAVEVPQSSHYQDQKATVPKVDQEVERDSQGSPPTYVRQAPEGLKADAIAWVQAYTGERVLTGKYVGEQFGRGATWGKQVLTAAGYQRPEPIGRAVGRGIGAAQYPSEPVTSGNGALAGVASTS